MAQLKLYTEEQVKDMLSGAMQEHHINEFIKKYYTPIELPSDELIEIEASYTYRLYPNNQKEHPEYKYGEDVNAPRKRKAFIKGAKWIIKQIINQNK